MPEIIYRRRAVSRRAWAVPLALVVVGAVYSVLDEHSSLHALLVNLMLMGLLMLVTLGIWLLTLYSMNRYGTVTVTRDTLVVGRERLALDRLDPAWVRMLAGKASPPLRERVAASGGSAAVSDRDLADRDTGRLLGGAYGSTLGSDVVTLRQSDGRRVGVATHDRPGLLDALLTALGD